MAKPLFVIEFPDDADEVELCDIPAGNYVLGKIGSNVAKYTYNANIPLPPKYLPSTLEYLVLVRYRYDMNEMMPSGLNKLDLIRCDAANVYIPPSVTDLYIDEGGHRLSQYAIPTSVIKLTLVTLNVDCSIPDHIEELVIYHGIAKLDTRFLPDKLRRLVINSKLTLPIKKDNDGRDNPKKDSDHKYCDRRLPDSLEMLSICNSRQIDWDFVNIPTNLHTIELSYIPPVEKVSDMTVILHSTDIPQHEFFKQKTDGVYLRNCAGIDTILNGNTCLIPTYIEPYPFASGHMIRVCHRDNYIDTTHRKSARK